MSGGAGVGHSPTDVQSVDAAVFSERHRSVTLFPGRLEDHRVTVESTSAEDIGVSDAGGYTGGSCCTHRLNLPRLFLRCRAPCGPARVPGVPPSAPLWPGSSSRPGAPSRLSASTG